MRASMRLVALTFAGGALGAALRFSLTMVWDQFWTIIAINLVGAALLGWLANSVRMGSAGWHAFLGTGFAGGFTSMSAVAFLFVQQLFVSTSIWPLLVLVAHLPVGAGAYWLVKKVTA